MTSFRLCIEYTKTKENTRRKFVQKIQMCFVQNDNSEIQSEKIGKNTVKTDDDGANPGKEGEKPERTVEP